MDKETGVFLGQPLVEVARAERSQEWIGASFGPSFQTTEYNRGFHLDTLLPYKSQYKDATTTHATGMAIDWPRVWRETRKTDPLPIIDGLDHNPAFARYYARTRAFVEFSKSNHDWFRTGKRLDYG